jgi:hypothetical protein
LITLHDIEAAIADSLKGAGHTVTAAETPEGFLTPTFFINIFQNGANAETQYIELVNAGVELRYFPDAETREALVTMADSLGDLLMSTPLAVKDRFLTINELTFDIDPPALLSYFELEFYRETAANEKEYAPIQNLQLGVKTNNGTSTSID